MKNSRLNLKGLVAASFSPMGEDGTLDLSLIEKMAERLESWNCAGVFVNGTTGESLSLTVEERKQIAAKWCRVARSSSLSVIIHVGHNSIPAAAELACHAEESGADAVGMMPPCYLKPENVDDLVECCGRVARQAPGIPFYYYHIPDLTGVTLSMTEFLEKGAGAIPNLAGIKYTSSDLAEFLQCLNFMDGAFDLLFGRDEALLAGLAMGAGSAIGSTYNFAAPIYNRIISNFELGNLEDARRDQLFMADTVALMKRYGFLPAAKAVMAMTGVPCGPVRLPLRELSGKEKTALRKELEIAGFFERLQI